MRDELSARRVPLRLVVIEDQALFRQLTVEVVRSDPRFTVVGEAADGREGWELCQRTRPDLVILDLNIPEPDGLALCGRLREELPDARVLAVTSYTDALTLTRLQDLGVAGYVEKDQPLETLRQALEALAGGGTFYTRIVAETRRRQQGDPHSFAKVLSSREQEILALVAAGLRSREIAERLGLSVRTVEGHRAAIMQKLGVKNLAGLLRFAQTLGVNPH